jgi:transposase-like protein
MMAKSRGKYHDWITEQGLTLIEGWAFDGLTDKQIAEDKIGINETTLHRWKKQFPQVMQALKKGKEYPDRQVENALYKRAVGYEYEEQETWIEIDDNGKEKKKVRKIMKHVPPDVAAIIFYLKNRKPKEWRNNPEQDEGDSSNRPIINIIELPRKPEESDDDTDD